MTSRHRIIAAINHRPVDRIPIDFGGTRQSGISAFAYARLRKRMGLRGPFKVFDVYQMLAEIEQSVADRFGADCVALNRPAVAFGIVNENWKPYRLNDGTDVLVPGGFDPQVESSGDLVLKKNGQVIARMPSRGFYFDRYEKYPGASHPDLRAWRPPRISSAELDHYAKQAEILFEQTDKAIVAAMGPPYELFNGIGQGGFENWMMTFAEETEYVNELYGMLVDAWIENLRAFGAAVGQRVQVIQICDDFGTQHAPFLSVSMFREKLLPAYRCGLDWVHANTNWKVLLHSDGAIYPLLPSIIEMGVDILNPVQTTAQAMEPQRLKREFGDKLVFWGGACDCQGTLTRGTPRQVRDQVHHNLSVLGRGGGLVMASVHNIQANVPPENVETMFDAALNFNPEGGISSR